MDTVSIIIINYNGEKFLKECLQAVDELEYSHKEIIFIDNASQDGSLLYVLAHFPHIRLSVNSDNKGYAAGANQGIALSKGEFVLVINPDVVMERDYVKILVHRMQKESDIGAIIGKVRVYDFARGKKTNIIDSAGLIMKPSRQCVDRGQGTGDSGQYDASEEVFGVTGACALYRRAALEKVKIFGEYFDEDFFMYKEDVDISWRLGQAGFRCVYEPQALAYHGRGTGAVDRSNLFHLAAQRKNLSRFQRYYSYKNERLMRVKNEEWKAFLRTLPATLWRELLMCGWILFREPFLIKSFFYFIWQLPRALRKRKEINRRGAQHDSSSRVRL